MTKILSEDLDYLFKINSTMLSIVSLKCCLHTLKKKNLRNTARIKERLILETVTVTG